METQFVTPRYNGPARRLVKANSGNRLGRVAQVRRLGLALAKAVRMRHWYAGAGQRAGGGTGRRRYCLRLATGMRERKGQARRRGAPAVCPQPLCPLSRVQAGVAVRIKELCASPEVACRLREMGLAEEQIIKLLANHSHIVCKVCNARLAISSLLADTILVQPLDVPAPAAAPEKL